MLRPPVYQKFLPLFPHCKIEKLLGRLNLWYLLIKKGCSPENCHQPNDRWDLEAWLSGKPVARCGGDKSQGVHLLSSSWSLQLPVSSAQRFSTAVPKSCKIVLKDGVSTREMGCLASRSKVNLNCVTYQQRLLTFCFHLPFLSIFIDGSCVGASPLCWCR